MLVSQHFYPSNAAGARLLTQLATDLVAAGGGVTAICSGVHYTTDGGESLEPHGRHGAVEIRRFAPLRFDRSSLVGRTANEVAYSLRVMFALLFRARPDAYVVLSSPPFLAPAVAFAARLRRVPLVYVVMDVFPDMAAVTGMLSQRHPLYRAWDAAQRFALRSSRRIVVLGRCMHEVIVEKLRGVAVPIDINPNWADGASLHPVEPGANLFLNEHPELRGKVLVQYSGNLGRFHDFETILAAAEILKRHDDVRLVIIGDGARRNWIKSEIERRELTNVVLLPFQPQDMLVHSLNAADIALVTLEPGAEGLCVPSKFYPLLAVGKPVVAVMSPGAEVALVTHEADLGRVVDVGDPTGLAAAIETLAQDPALRSAMAARARALFAEEYGRASGTARYVETLRRAVGRAASREGSATSA